jgi:hypothetical protein
MSPQTALWCLLSLSILFFHSMQDWIKSCLIFLILARKSTKLSFKRIELSGGQGVHTCNPNCLGSWDWQVWGWRPAQGSISLDPVSKITGAKWTEICLKWQSTYFASIKSSIQTPVPSKKKKKKKLEGSFDANEEFMLYIFGSLWFHLPFKDLIHFFPLKKYEKFGASCQITWICLEMYLLGYSIWLFNVFIREFIRK